MFFIEKAATDTRYFFGWILVVVVSICLHELAHGLVAVWLGDDTPIEQERMTLNPMVHMGPVSLIALLIGGIAWGAMPIDPRRMRGRYAPALVAAAGPATNFLLAALSLIGLGLWARYDPTVIYEPGQKAANGQFLLFLCGVANVLLGLFNLIPFPPLDGSRILGNLFGGYERAVEGLVARSPMIYIQCSLLVFIIAGNLLSPVAFNVSNRLIDLAAGWH